MPGILGFCSVLCFLWIFSPVACETDFNTCSFFYWRVGWASAVRKCREDNKQLLCYKSKKEIDDITEAFRLSAFGNAELELWLSSRNCTDDQMEECLSLHIEKSAAGIWHYLQKDCKKRYPFVCCINGTEITTETTSATTTTLVHTSSSEKIVTNTTLTSPATTTTISTVFCKKIRKRGIDWPNTKVGKTALQPCPGKSTGKARWSCEKDLGNGKWKETGPDLSECRSLEIKNLKEKYNSSTAQEVINELETIFQDKNKEVFGEDLADVISLMTSLPHRLFNEIGSFPSESRWKSTKESVDKSLSVFDHMIELDDTWQDISKLNKTSVGTHLVATIDEMGIQLADAMAGITEEQSIIGKNIAMQVMKMRPDESVFLPQWEVTRYYSRTGSIFFEKGYDSQIDSGGGNVSVVFALYSDMTNILTSKQNQSQTDDPASLNSAVVSATLTQDRKPITVTKEVKILVEHITPNPNGTACVFWNLASHDWDTSGCRLDSSNGSYTLCVCNHLTNFAVLMDYEDVLYKVDPLPLHYITLIGCILSIICLFLCVIVFSCYSYHSRHSYALRYVIHRNLCLTLLIANIVLVFGIDRTDNQKLCTVVAGLLHYFFLSAFSWMLLEGVHIYLLLVVVFASRRSHSEKYYIFGYGFPLFVVAITAAVRPTYYGTDENCWLSPEKGTIWGFIGPVAGILLVNTAALLLAQWKASKISIKDDNIALIKRWLRVTFILFPVLGVTWVFGFFYIGKHFEIAGYLFTVFNSFQGFLIFVFHCLMDKKARNMVIASFKKKTASVNTGSSGTHKKSKDPQVFVLKKAANVPLPDKKDFKNISELNNASELPKINSQKTNWKKWKKPWSFCFDMPVSENGSQGSPAKDSSKAVVVKLNSVNGKNCQ